MLIFLIEISELYNQTNMTPLFTTSTKDKIGIMMVDFQIGRGKSHKSQD